MAAGASCAWQEGRMGEATHWWDEPAAAFEAWLAAQSEEVQDLDLLEQIELYAAECRQFPDPRA